VADSANAYVQQSGEGEVRGMGETSAFFLADGDRTGGAFALVDERASRGMSVPLHLHMDDMESFYMVEGEVTFFLGDQPGVRATAGAFAHIPGGAVHGFRIESEFARYLILTTPRHGQFYRALMSPSLPGGLPPLESLTGPQIHDVAVEYGIQFVGPLPDDN
jgi:quercetin dioxygenase-like cupin family protein